MVLIAGTTTGCSLFVTLAGRSGAKSIRGPALSFRLDRPGFRPLHFQCRTSTTLFTTPRDFPLASNKSPINVSRAFRRIAGPAGLAIRPFATNQSPSNEKPPVSPLEDPSEEESSEELTESPYTIPNALTLTRIIACPFLGYQVVQGNYEWATGLLFACGVSDWLDGFLARRFGGKSVLGSILDPAADKLLMTTLVITLAWASLLPVPLAVLILGRDVALSISAFYFRFISLPQPRTLSRYFNPSIPSAEVKPTQISKINTALQLLLMGVTTVSPLITAFALAEPLTYLQWIVAGTTVWSGLSYVGKAGVRILPRPKLRQK